KETGLASLAPPAPGDAPTRPGDTPPARRPSGRRRR
ncbi:MAG: hypothetical protein V7637_2124, partial [Mycobacteriales bacterium]